MPSKSFEIRIDSHESEAVLSPESVSAGDLAKVMTLVEKAILETAHAQGVPLPDTPVLSVVGIQQGSDVMVWRMDPSVERPTYLITSAIRSHDFSEVTAPALKVLHELWRLSQRMQWAIQFAASETVQIVDAVISPDREIPTVAEVTGTTIVYGQCIRVGGEEDATARIRLIDGKLITARLTRPLAKRLAELLYEEVALEGEATWTEGDFEIVRFTVERLAEYKETSLVQAFDRLRQAGGDIWDNIDPVQYLDELRAD